MKNTYLLKLYILGSNMSSELALRNLKEIIAQETESQFQLEVIDVLKHPQLAEDDKIVAIPTLIKQLPEPFRKIIGDLSNREKVLLGLDIIPQHK